MLILRQRHNYTAVPFPVLLVNMYAIVNMQSYIPFIASSSNWSEITINAFWIILRGLVIANILFNFILFYWFLQSNREVSLLESMWAQVPKFMRSAPSELDYNNGTDVDIEKVAIFGEE
ncbi:hypothetical protein HK100_011130 [Physocladia obscura]|uniref:Uncharacterized protein n=1 Tax=Physocladia obscura TaxID=109957 RepID=A0AAD5T4C6_9FUNG|nr:hypothetical protein HK100_011130 [Physocladia obscura]